MSPTNSDEGLTPLTYKRSRARVQATYLMSCDAILADRVVVTAGAWTLKLFPD